MKIFKYILSVAAMLSLAVACNHDPDDIVISSTDPVIASRSDVVVNDLTLGEDFTLIWSAARYGRQADVEYTVMAATDGNYVTLGATSATNFTCTNAQLFEVFGISYVGKYDITFKVVAEDASGEQKEAKPIVVRFDFSRDVYLWALGGYQNWDPDAPASRLWQGEDGIFRGFIQITDAGATEFKLSSQSGWDGTSYGPGAGAGELSSDNAPNFSMAPALYYMEANLEDMTYVALELTSVSLIGEAVGGWNDTDDVVMFYDASQQSWVAIADIVSGKEYKVRFNKAWNITEGGVEYDCSLGGAADNLAFKGANLIAAGDGITSFTLSLFDFPYTIKEGGVSEANDVLYVANSANNWNYMEAAKMQPQYENDVFNNTFCGLMELSSAGQYLFSRLQTPLGTRIGGSPDALTVYPGGTDAVGMPAPQGLSYVYADLNDGVMKAASFGITSVGVVGAVNGWDQTAPVEFTYNSASKTWKASTTFPSDGEFKIVMNKMWNTVVDGVTLQTTLGGSCTDLRINGGNLFMTQGAHELELNLAKTPFTLAIDGKIADLSADPDYLELTGAFAHYEWNLGVASPVLAGYKDKSRYAGFVDMYKPAAATSENTEFKVTYPGWSVWLGGALQGGTTYKYDIAASNGDNMTMPFGLYFWDITLDAQAKTGTATALEMKSAGLIGAVNGTSWSQDFNMTSSGNGIYTVDAAIDGEFKIRLHEDGYTDATAWSYSLGFKTAGAVTLGTETALTVDGQNMSLAAGNYTVTLNLAKSPNTITVVSK